MGIAVASLVAVALFGYVYWMRFQHWHEVCYPTQRLCFHGRYLNWSTLEFDRVFWSPATHSLDGCPIDLVIGGGSYKLADLSPDEMPTLGAELRPTSNPGTVWMKFPSSESAYELAFGFDGSRIVSFSIQRHAGRVLSGQDTVQVMIDGKPLALPIAEAALTAVLGPPEVRRRQLMWP